MQYMILMGYNVDGVPPITTWDPEDVTRHIEFQNALGLELSEAGELVGGNGLAGPEDAKIVVSDGSGAPAVTDGPFPESKEFLAGYYVVDCETVERATELAALIPDARYTAIEVRPVMNAGGEEM